MSKRDTPVREQQAQAVVPIHKTLRRQTKNSDSLLLGPEPMWWLRDVDVALYRSVFRWMWSKLKRPNITVSMSSIRWGIRLF